MHIFRNLVSFSKHNWLGTTELESDRSTKNTKQVILRAVKIFIEWDSIKETRLYPQLMSRLYINLASFFLISANIRVMA